MKWKLQTAKNHEFYQWSYGRVERIEDLYDPKIWGPTRDFACGCGKYDSREHCGVICDVCGVKVAADSASLRKTRCGHLRLIVTCAHPLGTESDRVHDFPVAPIAYRQNDNGTPNDLGKKYERLLEVRDSVTAQFPRTDPEDYITILPKDVNRTPIQDVLNDIVGKRGSTSMADAELAPRNTVLHELLKAVTQLDASVSALVHSMGCTVRLEGCM